MASVDEGGGALGEEKAISEHYRKTQPYPTMALVDSLLFNIHTKLVSAYGSQDTFLAPIIEEARGMCCAKHRSNTYL